MTLSACPSVALILVSLADIPPVAGMGILLARAMALHADIGIRMAALAGLQIPAHLRRMIRIPAVDLRAGPRRTVGFDPHAPLLPRLAVAVRTEIRLVAAAAGLGVVRRLYRMDRNEIRPVRPGHGLPSAGQAPGQIGIDVTPLVAVGTEGLLMAIRAIAAPLLGQQSMLFHKKGAVVAHHPGAAVAVLTFIKLRVSIVSVVGPGE